MVHANAPAGEIAIVIPVWNRAGVLARTLDSVAAQTRPPDRVILVDDGSEDDCQTAVSAWHARRQPRFSIQFVRQSHQGAPAARNRGLRLAGGCRWIAFLDSDDCWPACFLQRAADALATQGGVAATADRLTRFHDNSAPRHERLDRLSNDATGWIFENDGGIGSATLLETRSVELAGGYDESLPTGHDTELFLRISLFGPWKHLPGAPVTFQRSSPDGSRKGDHLSERFHDRQRRWAEIHERFARSADGIAVPKQRRSRVLFRRWNYAAADLFRAGDAGQARACLRRAIRWRPWAWKSWLRLLRSYVADVT